jgi:hypothetical protein
LLMPLGPEEHGERGSLISAGGSSVDKRASISHKPWKAVFVVFFLPMRRSRIILARMPEPADFGRVVSMGYRLWYAGPAQPLFNLRQCGRLNRSSAQADRENGLSRSGK